MRFSTCLSQTNSPSAWSPCSYIPDGFSMPSLPLLSAPNLTPGPSPPGPTVLPSSSPGSSFHLSIKSSPQNPLLVSKFQAPRIKESSNSKHPGQDFLSPLLSSPTRLSQRGEVGRGRGRAERHSSLEIEELEGVSGRALEPKSGRDTATPPSP